MSNIVSTESLILDFYKLPEFQKLSAYYMQSTVFNVLGVQRSENRHSAFLAWLLNPSASHSLKEMPLRKFLALVAAKAEDEEKCKDKDVRQHLLSGNYQISVDCIKAEQSIVRLAKENMKEVDGIVEKSKKGHLSQSDQNRFDIWMLLRIKFTDEQDCEQNWVVPVVVENKIYSTEGNAGDKDNAQTVRYHKAMEVLKDVFCDGNCYSQPLLVYLTPSDVKNKPTAQSFIHLTYQELLDHVIQPCSTLTAVQGAGAEANVLIDGYIRNLSCPSNRDGEKKKDYSILAIAETEGNELEKLFNSNTFKMALLSVYSKEASKILEQDTNETSDNQQSQEQPTFDAPDDRRLFEHFWNANESLFKIVLYNHVKNNEEKMAVVQRIIKVSNRDNTRYFVAKKQGESWLNTKPASKSEASFLIFNAYCQLHQQQHPNKKLTIEDLRKQFDCSLNSYYHNRFLTYLFYDIDQKITVDVKTNKHYGEVISNQDTWDFYWDDAHQLPHVEGNVRNVKMWRKDDFESLVKKAKEFGIVVEAIE